MINVLIFDFAGVLTTERCFPALAKRLSTRFNINKKRIQKRLYANEKGYLLGNESTQDFWRRSLEDLGVPYREFETIFSAWYELNEELLGSIKKLKDDHLLIVLSDNFDAVTTTIRKDKRLKDLFEEMYFSNEMHLWKKDKELFKIVLTKLNKKPSECVFVDDKEENLTIPKELGMQVILFERTAQLKKELAALGIGV